MRLLVLALILPAAIVLGIAAFETRIFYPPPSNAPAAGIVWHGHTFAARDDFARWLRSRGVRYTVWAGRHQAFLRSRRRTRAQYAAGSERVGQKGFDGNVGRLGVGLAAFAGLGLVAVFLRRRRPGGLGSTRQSFRLAADRAAPVARRGTGMMLRRVKATAVLSSNRTGGKARSWIGGELGHCGRSRLFEPGRVVGQDDFPPTQRVRVVFRLGTTRGRHRRRGDGVAERRLTVFSHAVTVSSFAPGA